MSRKSKCGYTREKISGTLFEDRSKFSPLTKTLNLHEIFVFELNCIRSLGQLRRYKLYANTPQNYVITLRLSCQGRVSVTRFFVLHSLELFRSQFMHSFFSIQPQRPGWQEPEPSHVTGMALAHCILGKFLGVVCHSFPPPLDVPTFAARCLYVRNDARDPSRERWNCGREIVR